MSAGLGPGQRPLVTGQRVLGSKAVMSLVSLTAQGRTADEELPSPQLFCNSCWTRLEEEFKKLGGEGGVCGQGKAT